MSRLLLTKSHLEPKLPAYALTIQLDKRSSLRSRRRVSITRLKRYVGQALDRHLVHDPVQHRYHPREELFEEDARIKVQPPRYQFFNTPVSNPAQRCEGGPQLGFV